MMDQALLNNRYAHPETGHNAGQRLGMLRIRRRMKPCSMATHSSLSASVRVWTVCGGLDDGKHASGAYPTNVQLDLSPGIELATP